MAREKKTEEKKSGCPEWLATYGDMVTLVLTFFVLLYSFSTIDAKKWQAIVSALSGNPSIFEDLSSAVPPIQQNQADPEQTPEEVLQDAIENADEWEMLAKRLGEYIVEKGLEMDVTMDATDLEIVIRLRGDLLFESGRDDIREDAQVILSELMRDEILPRMESIGYIRVEGHTDNLPIHTQRFRNNWDLATARAVSVYLFLESNFPGDVNPKSFATMGWGENWPVADNNTVEGRAQNRRVEFVLVNPSAMGSVSQPGEAPAA